MIQPKRRLLPESKDELIFEEFQVIERENNPTRFNKKFQKSRIEYLLSKYEQSSNKSKKIHDYVNPDGRNRLITLNLETAEKLDLEPLPLNEILKEFVRLRSVVYQNGRSRSISRQTLYLCYRKKYPLIPRFRFHFLLAYPRNQKSREQFRRFFEVHPFLCPIPKKNPRKEEKLWLAEQHYRQK